MNSIIESNRRRWIAIDLAIAAVGVLAAALSWPGFATHDTIFLTQEAERGAFTTYHPLLNGLLQRFLVVPLESYGLYTGLQIVLCCFLFARSLRCLAPYRWHWLPWVAWVLWLLSVPTLLYLGVVWKDVPIAYALLFLAAMAYRVQRADASRWSKADVAAFGLAMVAATSLRHGMAINLVLVPLFLGIGRIRSDRRLMAAYAVALAVWAMMALLSRSSLVHDDPAHYLKLKIGAVSQPFLGIVTNRNGYTTDDIVYDDLLAKKAFGPNYATDYSPEYFRNQVQDLPAAELQGLYKAILRRTPRLCFNNLAACTSGRFQMLVGTLQPATRFGGMTFYDLPSIGNCPSTYGMSPASCDAVERYALTEKPDYARRATNAIVETVATDRNGLTNLYAWNMLPAALLVLVMLVWSAPGSGLWRCAMFILLQGGLPFLTAMANDFRYYYFLSPFFCVFAAPVVTQLCRQRPWSQTGKLGASDE